EIARRRFTVEEYERMGETGILGPQDRVELIDGEVVQKVTISPRHAACVTALDRVFQFALGDRAVIRVQNPVRLGRHDEPEPDLAVLRPPLVRYRDRHPAPADTLLVIEVGDASLTIDRKVKLPRYAHFGIPETWIIDLEADCIEVCRTPGLRGYRDVERVASPRMVSVQAFPDLTLAARDILG
ncbi:MAG TPA: Uma2 family endonuclease, partial [Methylomirabilota bacterium]|nr:Uma2 family endonuclease [Methylomirabilota bacterium]